MLHKVSMMLVLMLGLYTSHTDIGSQTRLASRPNGHRLVCEKRLEQEDISDTGDIAVYFQWGISFTSTTEWLAIYFVSGRQTK